MGKRKEEKDWAQYYDNKDILEEIIEEEIEISLEERLREDILSGKRRKRLQNITIKLDPFQIIAIKKLATMKSIPYQTLIRHWLSEEIKKELELLRR